MGHYDCPLCGEYGCLRTCRTQPEPNAIEWLQGKIKTASDEADYTAFANYTAILENWEMLHGKTHATLSP